MLYSFAVTRSRRPTALANIVDTPCSSLSYVHASGASRALSVRIVDLASVGVRLVGGKGRTLVSIG